ncbi:cob(I)yrinic acid a,c-diamide adenosyltransferase [Xylanibacter ruminicola]|uniref:Corrinoid adenosyltransferase n=1 Tax=Xylanibacter ruminicola TaxID=839 RepID=A0A1M6U469_XYLRU|nr:cob(I)yrinic acid a,c-diamide adenosyltransferase [Xylanibacter ruminicola]SHK63976.1 ATP:cob(I)alamin adenosyltransferase [Xylanibacter ruminicola]
MKITKVYTRGGDMGKTSLVGGQRVSKASVRLEAYGTVDELNSHLGLLAAMMADGEDKELIIRIQNCLFNVCTNLATDQEQTPLYPSAHLPEGEIELIEQKVDEIMQLLPERQGFILPGGTKEAAQAHVCRTVCRRAERRIVALAEVAQITPSVLQYVNRLSDYLFVLAKKINFNAHHSEIVWQNVGR